MKKFTYFEKNSKFFLSNFSGKNTKNNGNYIKVKK